MALFNRVASKETGSIFLMMKPIPDLDTKNSED